ncbi:MAG: CsoS2 family carboxysome shell protein [Gammaproteobacteria bacterium]|nr:CsoS2 family carboxysome shell protein [Gammaproteobacteria bacterium]
MSQANITMKATGGREASRERRTQLGQGKAGLPPAIDRTRMGEREATIAGMASVAQSVTPAAVQSAPAPVTTDSNVLTGRDASRTRRAGSVQGKQGIVQATASVQTAATAAAATPRVAVMSGNGRQAAQALRGSRARNGRGNTESTRPCGRVRHSAPLVYPAKVSNTETYAGKKVTGIRIGRSANMTGDEPGADVQVTGSQYIGKETGFNPREGGLKVGAARTANGQVVTGSQVRSKIMITGDESNSAIRITGEADQEINDDLLNRREQGAYTSMQFQRQNNPHGHTVFGTNLGRSIKSIGSRDRDREYVTEQTDGGLPVSGTAVGRSLRITGDEPGACRPITGTQYLMPGNKQPLCATPAAASGTRAGSGAMGMSCNSQGTRPDPVTGEKVVESETWTRQRITGVDVAHNPNVSGDEYGVCASVTGTPYAGPNQYETACATDAATSVAQRVMPGQPATARVTGDAPFNAEHVTGTQRGGDRSITGTPYFRTEAPEVEMTADAISNINHRFSVRSPQREGHLHADASAVQAPSAEMRITGAFAVGDGKITGNQEFHFSPRGRAERDERKSRITGEGRVEGPAITGSAWTKQNNVTGTEGHIAVERNPSERNGKSHAFANASKFKGKGNHEAPTQHVTGMVGWSALSAARVTLSGGAQG